MEAIPPGIGKEVHTVDGLAAAMEDARPADLDALASSSMGAKTVDETRLEFVAKIGENIQVRRFGILETGDGVVGDYVHGNKKIGVIVTLAGGDELLARISRCISPGPIPSI